MNKHDVEREKKSSIFTAEISYLHRVYDKV